MGGREAFAKRLAVGGRLLLGPRDLGKSLCPGLTHVQYYLYSSALE
jgi:hypothetical protein